MFCEQCGKKLPDGARFCPNCGTPCSEDDDGIKTQNGGTEEHVENVGEPIVENERTSDIENDNSDHFEVPKEPKNHTRLTKKAKMIISAVIAVVIIGAVGITTLSGYNLIDVNQDSLKPDPNSNSNFVICWTRASSSSISLSFFAFGIKSKIYGSLIISSACSLNGLANCALKFVVLSANACL